MGQSGGHWVNLLVPPRPDYGRDGDVLPILISATYVEPMIRRNAMMRKEHV